MNINGLAAIHTAAATGTTGSANGTSVSNPAQDTQSMFIKLLVAQLQNQSPLDPVDPTQFTSQLVQFNMLDQLTQINNTLTNTFGTTTTNSSASTSSNPSVQGAQ